MKYTDTWFGRRPMNIYASGICFGRNHWMKQSVTVFTGKLVSMNRRNPDGSYDVLGAEQWKLTPGFTVGSRNKGALQRSLAEYAARIADDGATVIRHTKNTLYAVYKNEKLVIEISQTCK